MLQTSICLWSCRNRYHQHIIPLNEYLIGKRTTPTAGWLSASQPQPHPTKSKTLSAFCNTKSHRLRHRNLCRERCEHVRLGRVVKDFTNYRTTTYAAAITKEEEVSPSVEKSETTRPFIFFFRQRDSSRLTHS